VRGLAAAASGGGGRDACTSVFALQIGVPCCTALAGGPHPCGNQPHTADTSKPNAPASSRL